MPNALISGGRGLLGQQFAKTLEGAGYKVFQTDLPEHDVTVEMDWKRLAEVIPTDVLINCAGITNNTKKEGFQDVFGAWEEVLRVNLTGTMLGCKIIGEKMLKRGKGCIINIASQYGLIAPRFDIYEGTDIFQPAAYSASKGGVLALTRYLACLWGRKGVRVNAITPGGVFNGQDEKFITRFSMHNPLGRLAKPEEIAPAALFIAENEYINGANIVVDGGWTAW